MRRRNGRPYFCCWFKNDWIILQSSDDGNSTFILSDRFILTSLNVLINCCASYPQVDSCKIDRNKTLMIAYHRSPFVIFFCAERKSLFNFIHDSSIISVWYSPNDFHIFFPCFFQCTYYKYLICISITVTTETETEPEILNVVLVNIKTAKVNFFQFCRDHRQQRKKKPSTNPASLSEVIFGIYFYFSCYRESQFLWEKKMRTSVYKWHVLRRRK